ncbi:heat-shock protein [Bradyrhizobium sp. WBOS7]|uniref:Heat-shock protein n=2 Tax=Nitrobacteraceae TaxID=41294 RepID=A0AAE9NBP9_9BRAD|nr:heat-shock protein [Bradyrhizobium sp. WBOS2]MDD1570612.1 heat-shock protein [Bradyrhizobium sp. WBOS1]MDD1578370.1 heat-shock protein [Bradyrhizobium sp. WBOS7]MDD1601093.1 heat-shock protein [Bradyrhizobium sp. WBOS16]UUO34923.1 heat-shock protein [Bradyrhizobium sp. WBOS01]UUO41252.1 heat-shock protein [Bradyrhizobium sp. WBOS02]UUO55569.1 heat-shock protein [Bradyrhizobium sp. WBOS07]UUO65618.1 heat-shock protein [Bradyrhizobium betae]
MAPPSYRRCGKSGRTRGLMVGFRRLVCAAVAMLAMSTPARAEDGFPFGSEMTLEALPQAGSKRIPNIEIGDHGEVVLELWCKGGKGQFSVAGNTVIFVPGQIQDRSCPPARAQADDELVAALSSVETWKRQGDVLTLIGPKPLRFRTTGN